MTQRELHRAVARATGESADRIARMGFQITRSPSESINEDNDLGPSAIDWDGLADNHSPSLVREFFRAPAFA